MILARGQGETDVRRGERAILDLPMKFCIPLSKIATPQRMFTQFYRHTGIPLIYREVGESTGSCRYSPWTAQTRKRPARMSSYSYALVTPSFRLDLWTDVRCLSKA